MASGLVAGTAASAPPALAVAGQSEIHASECRLGTESGLGEQFHALVVYPNEYALRVPGIVIGAEKSSADQVRRGALLAPIFDAPEGFVPKPKTSAWLKELLQGGRRSVFISHVAAFDGHAARLPFDAYRPGPAKDQPDLPGDLKSVPWLDCQRDPVVRFDAYADSWRGIGTAREQIRADLLAGGFTHVLLLTMGWNTVQTEAMQNYASLIRNLQRAAAEGPDFKPYVVGFTWPSQWDSAILGSAIVRPASLMNKANDADEFAAGWLGAALRHAVVPGVLAAKAGGKPVKVVAIGHSFGARALTHAICRGTVLETSDPSLSQAPMPQGFVDTLFSLQGAYSLNRFRAAGAGAPELAYAPGCPAASKLVFTASSHDAAAELASKLPGPLWAGAMASWTRLQREGTQLDPKVDFRLCRAFASGQTEANCLGASAGRFVYVDASALIRYRSFGTGGGAHSDIYREATGRFLWNFIPR